MARPEKRKVDYFPHQLQNGKTLFMLESEFGNDGYAFWFKLLELLGQSDNHYYDCNEKANKMYLASRAKVDVETADKILDILSDLKAIDQELWREHKIIWSQNFVDNIADAYKRRNSKVPSKPCFNENGKLISKQLYNDPTEYLTIIKHNFSVNMRQSLKGYKVGNWENLVGYSLKDLVKRLEETMPEGCNWQNYLDGELHIDHIIPISAFNFTDPEDNDFKCCWALDNLQLLTAKDNMIKGNRLAEILPVNQNGELLQQNQCNNSENQPPQELLQQNQCTNHILNYTKLNDIKLNETKPQEIIVEDIKKEKVKKNFDLKSIPYQLAYYLRGKVKEGNKAFIIKGEEQLQNWAYDFDLMIRIDKREPKEIAYIIKFATEDSFWSGNILSASKLRIQYAQLWKKSKGKYDSSKPIDIGNILKKEEAIIEKRNV